VNDDAGTAAARIGKLELHLLEQAVAHLNDIVLITEAAPLDEPGPRIVFANPAFTRHTGYPLEQALGRSPRFLQGPKTSRAELQRIRAALTRGEAISAELVNYAKDGREILLQIDIQPIHDPAGRCTHFVAIEREMSGRKRDLMLQALTAEILGLLSSGAALSTVLERIARGIESMIDGALASILLLDEDGAHIRHGAAPSLPEAFVRAIDGSAIGPAAGSCGTAMSRGETVIAEDIAGDPLWADWRTLALQHGLRACWSSPVKNAEGTVLGSFALYHRSPRRPQADEIDLIGRVQGLVATTLERALALDRLRASEARFRELAENIGEVFWVLDASRSRLLYVSQNFADLFGFPAEQLFTDLGSWRRAVHPDDRPRIENIEKELGERALAEEYRIFRPDGSLRWIHDRSVPIHGPRGLERIIGAVRDITLRKEMETAVRDSQERFQAVANATADVIWDWDLTDDSIWWSGGYTATFGHVATGDRLPSRSWTQFIHAEDQDRIAASVRDVVERRLPYWEESYRFVKGDGTVIFVEDRGTLIFDRDGKPIRFVGGMADVTEKLSAREALAGLQSRMDKLVNEARIGILVHENFKPILANAHLAQMLGYDGADEILALDNCSVLFAQSEQARIAGFSRRRWPEDGAPGFYEVRGRCKDGRELDLENRAFPIDWGGRKAICAMLSDVTERKRMEGELRQSQRMEAIGPLTGGIAHDFNNLLTVILGNAEALADELPKGSPPQRMAEMTKSAAERGSELTGRLLAFARRQTLDPRPTDIAKLVHDIDGLLRRILGEHIEIRIDR